MEFASRSKCIDYYQEQFQNLPRYMIEMALDYDLQSTQKPKTGKEKRQAKRQKVKTEQEKTHPHGVLAPTLQEALASGKPLEIDSAQVVSKEDYQPAPFMKGCIEVDGLEPVPELEPEPEDATDRFMQECIADGLAYEVVENDAKF